MARVAVFSGPSVKRNVESGSSKELTYEFFSLAAVGRTTPDLRSFDLAIVELASTSGAAAIRALRRATPEKLIASPRLKPDAPILQRAVTLGFYVLLSPTSRR